jgi:F-type H+-transporting ATPase subunit epsilon
MLQVELVTPERRVLKSEADEVTLTGTLGQLTVLPGHIPLLTGLEPGPMILKHGGSSEIYAVAGGVAQIDHDKVTILAEAAEARDDIDVPRAERAKVEAQKLLLEKSAYDAAFAETEAAVMRAAARIDIARRV